MEVSVADLETLYTVNLSGFYKRRYICLIFYNLSAPDFVELSRDILEKIIGIRYRLQME